MRLTIEVNLDGAAFDAHDPAACAGVLAQWLRRQLRAERLHDVLDGARLCGGEFENMRDPNGNTVGFIKVEC